MKIGSILNDALDGLFGLFLPEEVVQKVVDPVTDGLGAGTDALTGNAAGAAKNLLDLAEDFAQWSGRNELARQVDRTASLAKALLDPPMATGRGLGVRAAGALAGAAAGYAAKGDLEGAAAYGKMGLTAASATPGGLVGGAAGAGVGAMLRGEKGAKLGFETGVDLGRRLEELTREDVRGLRLATGVSGVGTRLGGIAIGLYLSSHWSVWRKGQGTTPNLEAFQWAAGAGATCDGMLEQGRAIGQDDAAPGARRKVCAALAQAARAAHVVRQGFRIHQERVQYWPGARGRDVVTEILGKVPLALDWLAQPPKVEPQLLNLLGEEIFQKLKLKPWELRRQQILGVPA
jgi:hypothetical protein